MDVNYEYDSEEGDNMNFIQEFKDALKEVHKPPVRKSISLNLK